MNRNEILNYLTPLFIEQLDKITNTYKVIGISGDFARKNGIGSLTYDESPMWLQFKGANSDNNAVLFKCSLSNVGFEIPLSSDDIDTLLCSRGGFSGIYDYFKRIKYLHLKEHHPTVWYEQEFHIPRIIRFLVDYNEPEYDSAGFTEQDR
jgi:hypothetical protein